MSDPSKSADANVRLVSRAILAIGIVLAVVIFFVNAPPAVNSADDLEDSKAGLRQMEMYGGTANVLAAEVRTWFDSLWHGRTLAFTVAVIAVLASVAYRFLASPLPTPAADSGSKTGTPNDAP